MAKDLNRSIKIYIDNSDAMASATKLEGKIENLQKSLAKLASEGKKNTDEYDRQKKALDKYTRSYGNYQKTIKDTDRVLKNLSGSTYKELKATRRILQRELQKEQRGTESYTAKLKAYQAVQKQIVITQKEMNGTLGAQGTIMSRAANGFNKYFGMATTFIASITGISFTLRKLSQDAAQMEDTYADVMKTTGMTRDEVGELNDEFKKMDTRTSREQLNMLARDAGKLGLSSKKDVLDFVEAGNQINVALGEDLGEGAIRNIGKMSEVFRRSTQELDQMDLKGRMLSIGSAINELGQSSTASEQYLVAFAGRLGGVAAQAGIGIDKILGYASALDQDMQTVEMSATALQKFIMTLMAEPAQFAKYAKMEVGEFNKLLQTDTNEAIKAVLRSMSEQGGLQQLIPMFQEMGLDGARAVGVLSSMANSIDKIDDAQLIANKAMREGISLTNEYNVKNENANAQLEKRRKAFKDAAEELGRRLNPALLKSTNYVTYLVKLLPGFLDFLGKYGKYILYLASAYAVYTAGVKLSVVWNTKFKEALTINNLLIKAKAAYLVAARIAMLAYNVVLGLITGNFTKLRTAWKALTAVMATNPIGLIAVAATTAIAGIIKLVKWLNRTSEATKAVKDATQQFTSELATEQREANALFAALKRTNPESNTHLQIRKEIISKYGKYLQGLIDEKGNITDIGKAIASVNNGLREQIALKIRNAATDKIMEDSINKQTETIDKVMKRIGMQVTSETVRSSIRETINRTITEFEASGTKDYAQLQQKLLADIQQTYGVDAYKGMRNVKNLIVDLVDNLRDSGKAADEVKEKFSGMISKMTDTASIIQNNQDDDPDGPVTPFSEVEEDKKKYQKKLSALEEYIMNEKNKLLQSYLDKEITEQGYARQLEFLETERLNKLLEIYNLDAAKRVEVENLLMEHKLKILKKIEDDEHAHQERIAKIQEDAEKARTERNWKALKAISKQNEDNFKEEFERRNKQKAELVAVGMDFANEMGSLVAGAVTGNEDIVASSLKSIISMGLDLLKVQVQMAIAGATAQSLAQPDSVATFGASGLARAAVLVGLIEAAFAVVKGVIGSTLGKLGGGSSGVESASSVTRRVITQRAAGKYDVIGANDNRFYSGVPYLGVAQTGIVPRPALVGEYGPELIVSAPDFSRLQKHVNYPLVVRAIQESRVPQRATGKYESISTPAIPAGSSGVDVNLLQDLRDLLLWLKLNRITAEVNYHEFKKADKQIESIKNKAGRS